jgi:class 3 adenylate cyclase
MECAIFFMEAIEDNNRRNNTPNLMLMIGINTDPAVAGVIGSKKVAYDLWGDSVNTASRMESTGIPGKIQVSDKTYNFVKEYYSFTDRKVAAKGKGELPTHIFSGRIKPSPYKHINWRVNVEH